MQLWNSQNYPKNASESVSYLPEICFRPGGFAPLVPLPGLCPGPTCGLGGPQTPCLLCFHIVQGLATPLIAVFEDRYKSFVPRYKSFVPRYKSFIPIFKSFVPRYNWFVPRYKWFVPRYKWFVPRFKYLKIGTNIWIYVNLAFHRTLNPIDHRSDGTMK